MADRSKRSLSPVDRGNKRRRLHVGEDRLPERDKLSERSRPRPRGLHQEEEPPAAAKSRWQGGQGEPELVSGGFEGGDYGPYSPPFGGALQGGRGMLAQGRTGRAPMGGPGRGHPDWSGGRGPGRLGGRGFDEGGGRDFGPRGRGRGFFRSAFPGRGRMLGRWGGRGRMGSDHIGGPVFGRAGRYSGPPGSSEELGPSGMRAGRGLGGRSVPDWGQRNSRPSGPPDAAGHQQPQLDDAFRERREKSLKMRLLRQVSGLQLPADLVDESVLDRLADIKGSKADDHTLEVASAGAIADMYMCAAIGANDKDKMPICQQRFDQAQAFEYCLQLYQAVPEVYSSKFGHFVPAASGQA